jgi:hypothetical protein
MNPSQRRQRKRKAALDRDGNERPPFLAALPDDPDLARVAAAFEHGDFAFVRREAPALARRTDDPKVREAALDLRRRIDPDPLAKFLLLGAFALLAFLVVWAYARH